MRIFTTIILPIPSHYLKEMLGLKRENYHRTAMGTKMAVAFANIFMAEIKTNLLNQSRIKPIAWNRYIDDVFSLWDTKREDLDIFITQANTYHPTIKFTAEISDTEITFLTQWFTKELDSKQNRSLTSKPIINRPRPSNTPTIPLVTSCKTRFHKG